MPDTSNKTLAQVYPYVEAIKLGFCSREEVTLANANRLAFPDGSMKSDSDDLIVSISIQFMQATANIVGYVENNIEGTSGRTDKRSDYVDMDTPAHQALARGVQPTYDAAMTALNRINAVFDLTTDKLEILARSFNVLCAPNILPNIKQALVGTINNYVDEQIKSTPVKVR